MVFGGCFRERRGSCQGGVFVRRSSVDLVKGDLVDGVVVVMLFLLGILDIFASCCLLACLLQPCTVPTYAQHPPLQRGRARRGRRNFSEFASLTLLESLSHAPRPDSRPHDIDVPITVKIWGAILPLASSSYMYIGVITCSST